MVWFVNVEPLDLVRGDEIDENSPGVAAKVLFSPEILEKVFKYMNTTTLVSVRSVCRKWHAVSEFLLRRRLRAGKPETPSVFYLKSLRNPQDYCSTWFRLNFSDEHEPRTPRGHVLPVYRMYSADEDESVGVSIEGLTRAVAMEHQRALTILEMLPGFDWVALITVLQIRDSLAIQDWIKAEGAVIGTLKSMKCMHLDLCWRSWTAEDASLVSSNRTIYRGSHDTMREIYFTYPWESWSSAGGAQAAEFEQRFLRMCPMLKVLCSTRQSFVTTCIEEYCLDCDHMKVVAKYDAMFKRKEYEKTWHVTFQYEVYDLLQAPTSENIREELKAMFHKIPIGILRYNSRENVDCVNSIVSSSSSSELRRLDINTVLMPMGAYSYVAQQIRNWSNNQAFSKVRTLVLTFGEIERVITEADFVPMEHNEGLGFTSSLNSVNSVEIGSFSMDYKALSPESLEECQNRDIVISRYWAGVLQFTPHVELLIFNGRARSLWSLAKRLPKLKHIVFRCVNPQNTFVSNNENFSAEMNSLIWGLQDLQSFTLDFEPRDQMASWVWNAAQVSRRAKALLNACNGRNETILVQINSPTLMKTDVELMLRTKSKTIVRAFHAAHGELYQTVKDASLDAFSWNAGGLVFMLSSKVHPVYEVGRLP